MTTLFDAFIFVDWSAASTRKPLRPCPDSVWVGEFEAAQGAVQESYHRTRESGVMHVAAALRDHCRRGHRVLVGFDFPYGYPAGFSASLSPREATAPWRRVWDELVDRVHDTADNVNNRFSAASDLNAEAGEGKHGPFWGRPASKPHEALDTRSPGFPFHSARGHVLRRLRIVESRLPGTQETWKLFGNGSVGSQALVGIPRVCQLRYAPGLDRISQVWPFETGFTSLPVPAEGPFVLHAEIWPGVVDKAVRRLTGADATLIRDRAQVRAMCEWASDLDTSGLLGHQFDVPTGLNPEQVAVCEAEEGWVLGA